jgi:hypothetical protein
MPFFPTLDQNHLPQSLNQSFQLFDEIIKKKSLVDTSLPLDISKNVGPERMSTLPLPYHHNRHTSLFNESSSKLPDIMLNGTAGSAELNIPSYRHLKDSDVQSIPSFCHMLDIATEGMAESNLPTYTIPTYQHVSMGADEGLEERNTFLVERVEELERELREVGEKCRGLEQKVVELEFEKSMGFEGIDEGGVGGMAGVRREEDGWIAVSLVLQNIFNQQSLGKRTMLVKLLRDIMGQREI